MEAQQPPGDLHQEGDHWTAWDVPETEGAEVYKIRPGDSLWSIAEERLGDPYLWPQVWEKNQYILDAHWIYPGDTLIVTGVVSQQAFTDPQGVAGGPLDQADTTPDGAAAMADTDDPYGTRPSRADDVQRFRTGREQFVNPEGPVPLGFESDLYCTGFVGGLKEEFPYAIAGSEYELLTPSLDPGKNSTVKGIAAVRNFHQLVTDEESSLYGRASTQKFGLGLGDIIFLAGGRDDGLSAGELLTAVRPSYKIHHPKTRKVLGRLYKYLGRIRVLSVQPETSIAEIVQLCTPITVGTSLKLFEPEPVPLRKLTPIRPVNFPAADEELEGVPIVLGAWDKLLTLGAGLLVFINHGNQEDMAPGDIYTIYRRGRRGFPPTVLGELAVLTVFDTTALARIYRSRYPIFVGDALHLK